MRHGGPQPARLLLASRSPRRTKILADAGIPHHVVDSGIDDADLEPGQVSPAAWVTALAYLKARAALDQARPADAILGADTVCVMDNRIIGQPKDDADAAGIILGFVGREHDVLTGVCVLRPADPAPHDSHPAREWTRLAPTRLLRHNRARVRLGNIPTRDISRYLASGDWRGKAGGYNFTQRRLEGWPLEVEGDEGTVVGLPLHITRMMLDQAGVHPPEGGRPSTDAPMPSHAGS
jgi:septum formation protein